MSESIVVLGCGLVGSAVAIDLADRYAVTSVDLDTDCFAKLETRGIRTRQADLSIPGEVKDLVSEFDLAIGALPGHLGYHALGEVIEAGTNYVDMSFMPEDYFVLDSKASKKGITAVVDCGLAPGMGNLILGYHAKIMEVDGFQCYVGGLPKVRQWPYEYKAVFSPMDVIEEYIRPARYLENGHMKTREALSDAVLMDFPPVGTLEAWNSDGLRSLLKTMKIPNMIEKTLRYPGTTEYLKVLRETGFFSSEEISIGGSSIRPLDFTAKLLFPKWKLGPGEGDLTVMKIIIDGKEKGKSVRFIYDLYDEYDPRTDTISMARTTGYTCTAIADLLLQEGPARTGILPLEYLGAEPGNFNHVMEYLRKRNVFYNITRERLGRTAL